MRFLSAAYAAWIALLVLLALFAAMFFGFTGFRTILSIALLFVMPIFLLLRSSSLDADEKVFFSLFIGLGFFPLVAWAVNRILPSFRLSVLAALALFALAGFFLPRVLRISAKKLQ